MPETRVIGLHLHCDTMGLSNFRGGLQKHTYFETECIMAIQGQPRLVVNFGTSQKRVCDFLLVINSNLGSILPISEILQIFC